MAGAFWQEFCPFAGPGVLAAERLVLARLCEAKEQSV